jgi:hypothetical protein
MDLGDQFDLEHLLFKTRQCRSCGKAKDLLTDFYRIRKDRKSLSAYSYECKECTKKRITKSRKEKRNKPDIPYDPVPRIKDVYPDW